MSQVFDCFMYCGEADVLEIRLNELEPVVDRFVLCEATHTFNHEPKPLYLLEQQERFARFLPKITHVVVEDLAVEASVWEREVTQRNALARGLVDCSPDDVVIISDVDEIPHPNAIRAFDGPISGLQMRLFHYYLNLLDVASPEASRVWSVMCRYAYLRSPQWLREIGHANNAQNTIVDSGGWHFSRLGDDDWITRRMSGGARLGQEVQAADRISLIRARMEAGEDLFVRDYGWEFVAVDASHPAYVARNQTRYERLIGKPHALTRPYAAAIPSAYYEHERPEVLALVPRDARRVLELGCASGALSAALKRRQECHVTGVEYRAEAAERASTRLDRVVVGDCEQLELDALFQPGEFDCLIAADVLEHLHDPERLLRRLQPFLTADAAMVMSLPNVRNAGVLKAAVQGYWTYQAEGILDRTHLRFYTRREIENMLTRIGFEVEEQHTVDDPALAEWERLGRPTSPTFGVMTLNGLDEQEIREFFVIQWLVRSRSAVRPRPSTLHGEPDAMTGLFGRIAAAEKKAQELTARLIAEGDRAQRVQAELNRRDEQLAAKVREAEDWHSQLGQRNAQLLDEMREAEDRRIEAEDLRAKLARLSQEHELLSAVHQKLSVDYAAADAAARDLAEQSAAQAHELAQLRIELAALQAEREIVQGSRSWRWTRPLRAVVDRQPAVLTRWKLGSAPAERAAVQLPAPEPPRVTPALAAIPDGKERAPRFAPRALARAGAPIELPRGERGRLLCISHVLPFPPRAGNEYRIHHLLSWLAAQGWDILLVVCPLPNEPITRPYVAETAAVYPNLIVCERDGTLLHHLRAGGAMLEGLRGRQPRVFAPLLGERKNADQARRELLAHTRTFCPDVLIELVLHLETEFDPHVLLVEYAFMTRPFPLVRSGLFKVVDTHDVFSNKSANVTRFGPADSLDISPDLEASLLERADLLIGIQPEEANDLRKLAPACQVISVGVDFAPLDEVPSRPSEPVILLVASANRINVKGLMDFLRFAWPLVRRAIPEAELRIVGTVGSSVELVLPGVRKLGLVDDLAAAYAEARVVINPAIAGTGLKIKTVEALCHLRPVVLWPSGADGLDPDIRALCHVAGNWFDFARLVIDLAGDDRGALSLLEHRSQLAQRFAPEIVYAPLGIALDAHVAGAPPAIARTENTSVRG